jgi:hypothetical protein
MILMYTATAPGIVPAYFDVQFVIPTGKQYYYQIADLATLTSTVFSAASAGDVCLLLSGVRANNENV